jgi:hypothetical protein
MRSRHLAARRGVGPRGSSSGGRAPSPRASHARSHAPR